MLQNLSKITCIKCIKDFKDILPNESFRDKYICDDCFEKWMYFATTKPKNKFKKQFTKIK